MIQRMIRASALDPMLFEEVEHDSSLDREAFLVVLLSSVAYGLGNIFVVGIIGILYISIAAVCGYLLWSFLTFIIGTTLLKTPETHATYGQLRRTIGFANAPGCLRLLAFLPGIGDMLVLGSYVWMLMTTVVAVKQALDFQSVWRAIAVCLSGWLIQIIIIIILKGFGIGMFAGG